MKTPKEYLEMYNRELIQTVSEVGWPALKLSNEWMERFIKQIQDESFKGGALITTSKQDNSNE